MFVLLFAGWVITRDVWGREPLGMGVNARVDVLGCKEAPSALWTVSCAGHYRFERHPANDRVRDVPRAAPRRNGEYHV